MKEQHCYVSLDYQAETAKSSVYKFPDGREVGTELSNLSPVESAVGATGKPAAGNA